MTSPLRGRAMIAVNTFIQPSRAASANARWRCAPASTSSCTPSPATTRPIRCMCRPYWRGLGNDERVEGVARQLMPSAGRLPRRCRPTARLGGAPWRGLLPQPNTLVRPLARRQRLTRGDRALSNWSIDFSPMVPSVLFWAGAALAGLLVALLLLRRSRGALLRALSLAALLLALANPTLRQEERESLANIAIVVVDESLSQSIGGRPEQTAAIRRELESKLAGIANLQVRWVTSSRPNGETASGTNLFADLNSALANTPPDRR